MSSTDSIELSIVVPLGARCENLSAICRALRDVLAPSGQRHEVIFVDDAADVAVRRQARQAAQEFAEVRVIRLQRRMGEAAALAVGARCARGEMLVTLDPYLHVAVAELPKLLAPLANGMDLVCAWRFPRMESGLGLLASNGFNVVARWLTKVPAHDLNCRMRAMRRALLQDLPMYGDLHRFLPIFASRRGYRWCEVQVPQQAGKREIGAFAVNSYVQRLLDLLTLVFLTRFVRRPLHFFGLIGLSGFLAGCAISSVLVYQKLAFGEAIGHRPMLLLGVLLLVVGIQIASIGLLGELLIFTHARDLKDYVVEEEAP